MAGDRKGALSEVVGEWHMATDRLALPSTHADGADEHPRHEDARRDPLLALTADQVARLTGLTERQLRYWDRSGFFTPGYEANRERSPYGRIYLYRDVVGLRAIAILRNDHHIPFQRLRKLGQWLKEHYDDPWSSLRFFVSGRDVLFEDPDTGLRLGHGGQVALPIEMADVEGDLRARAVRLRDRQPEEIGQITRRRAVQSNAPVLAGTRVPTASVWDFHVAGHDTDTILAAYPSLTPLDVERAIEFERRRRHQRAG